MLFPFRIQEVSRWRTTYRQQCTGVRGLPCKIPQRWLFCMTCYKRPPCQQVMRGRTRCAELLRTGGSRSRQYVTGAIWHFHIYLAIGSSVFSSSRPYWWEKCFTVPNLEYSIRKIANWYSLCCLLLFLCGRLVGLVIDNFRERYAGSSNEVLPELLCFATLAYQDERAANEARAL
jgi:hypothetical protein